MRSAPSTIRLEDLPELPAPVAMAGGLDRGTGGQPCAESATILALLVYGSSAV